MLIWTVKLPERKKCILAGVLALLLLVGLLSFAGGRGRSSDALARQEDVLVLCLDCLEGFGWEVAPTPVSTEDFTLDAQLSQDYLALQQEAGFDLSDDLGCVVTRYTFEILNYPTGEQGVLADLLVRDGVIVGGDVRTSGLEGFLHSLNRPTES